MAKRFTELGFDLTSTSGTAVVLREAGLTVESVYKLAEGRPNTLDLLKNREIQLVINTPLGLIPRRDENDIRSEAVLHSVPVITTLGSAFATLQGIRSLKEKKFSVKSLQAYHP